MITNKLTYFGQVTALASYFTQNRLSSNKQILCTGSIRASLSLYDILRPNFKYADLTYGFARTAN